MKLMPLATLLAGTLMAWNAVADDPVYRKHHYNGHPAYDYPKHGNPNRTADTSTHGRDRHRNDHDRHGSPRGYGNDDNGRDRGKGHDRPPYGHDSHGHRNGNDQHSRHDRGSSDATGEMIVGGLLGGFVGNTLASEGYGTQGTILGALVGTAIGYGIARNRPRYGDRNHR